MPAHIDPLMAKSMAARISPQELQVRISKGEPVQVIDVREFPEFSAGHIPSAHLMPLSGLESHREALDRTIPIICVCRSGKRSAQAAEILKSLGFGNVSHLEGGVLAWEECGLPLQRDVRSPWSIERQVRLALGLFVLLGLSLSLLWPATLIITWIIGVGMVFTAVIDWCGTALLLAKAPWNRQRRPCGR